MRDRKQIRETIEGVTAETGGWDSPPTWSQIGDVFAALLAPAQTAEAKPDAAMYSAAEIEQVGERWRIFSNDSTPVNDRLRASVRRVLAGDTSNTSVKFAEFVANRAEIVVTGRRKPAPSPVPGDAAPDRAGSDMRAALQEIERVASPHVEAHGLSSLQVDMDRVYRLAQGAWLHAPAVAAPAPDALRERAIRAVAARLDDEAAQILQRVEAGGREDELIEAIGERLERFTVAAVERALRDEREAAYQRGRADAAKTREDDATVTDDMCACCGERPAALCDLCVWCDAIMHGDARKLRPVAAYLAKHGGPATTGAEMPAPREEAPAGVLAVVERATDYDDESGAALVFPDTIMLAKADAATPVPDRVTVAVLTGPLAGIVEENKRREEWHRHVYTRRGSQFACGCAYNAHGQPHVDVDCVEGRRLAAAVEPIK